MMFDKELKDLEVISQAVGNSPDLVQGGGGNTSVKLNGNLMAVKASGFKLSQITPADGYVVVDYQKIIDYFNNVDLNSDIDYEKDSVEFVKKNIIEMEGIKSLRPSVEAGFHSILKKNIIHTHPVYANILCCSQNGEELMEKIFAGKEYSCIWVSYINPGFCLTLRIKEKIDQCVKKTGRFPEVVFMENHGLIVTSDDPIKCIQLHEEVNQSIKDHLGINREYPVIELDRAGDETFVSKTEYIKDFIKRNEVDEGFFDRLSLYPDQLVYLNSSISTKDKENKLSIDAGGGRLLYKTNYSEAATIEETLLAYLFVIDEINKCGLAIKTMSPKDIDFIKNWESEAYRKNLVKELNK